MRITTLITAIIALPLVAVAQGAPTHADSDAPARSSAAKSMLGVTVSASGFDRDTLGILVASVTKGGPADRAGITQGSRLGAVNGVNLRLDPTDVGRRDAADALLHKFDRELQTVDPGNRVSLKVYASGRYRTVAVTAPGQADDAAAPDAADVGDDAAVAAVATKPARTAAPPSDTLSVLIAGVATARSSLHAMAQGEDSRSISDSLTAAERQLAAVEQELKTVQMEEQRRAAPHAAAAAAPKAAAGGSSALPGIKVQQVTPELAKYFGPGTENGLLVLQADATWDPIKSGDVILTVNGEQATMAGLREAMDPQRESQVEITRHNKVLTRTLHGSE